MNLENLDIHSVKYNQPQLSRTPTHNSVVPTNGVLSSSDDYVSDTSDPETVIRWSTAPQYRSNENIRSEGWASESTIRPLRPTNNGEAVHTASVSSPRHSIAPSPTMTQPEKVESSTAEVPRDERMEAHDRRGPTPMDDTPYIRYAIDQLTREGEAEASSRPTAIMKEEEDYPVDRIVSDAGLGYVRSFRRMRGPSVVDIPPPSGPQKAAVPATDPVDLPTSTSEIYIPVQSHTSPRYPDLTFQPKILRVFSLALLMLLCLLMITAIMFCAIYSLRHNGLADNFGGLYSGKYFVFGFLAQILGAILMVYVECVMSAVARIAPYTLMASEKSKKRGKSLFMNIYPRSLLWPKLEYFRSGQPILGAASLLLWPVIFTIPLQSALFAVVQINGVWRWSAVQGVAWTLVAIYVLALVALALIVTFFFRRKTGLMWDPRSLADIISLLPRSNSLADYQDTEILASKRELRDRLTQRSDRLGYWRTPNPDQEFFYCIGEEGSHTRRYTISREGRTVQQGDSLDITSNEKRHSENERHSPDRLLSRGTDSSLLAKVYSPAIRFRYLPWILKDSSLILWPIAFFILYLALLIVSFLPSTKLSNGFSPLLYAGPNHAGFSSANFLYSFIPSIVGLILYLALQHLTATLATLTPWANLTRTEGVIPEHSLLLDYAYALPTPFAALPSALVNQHYVIAFLAFMQPLTLLLPVLAGGFLFPLTAEPSNSVLMFPNIGSFYVMLVILGLYLLALLMVTISLMRGRRRGWHLPHAVSCLAEIISFLYASEILKDDTFRRVRSKTDLRARLVGKRIRNESAGLTGGSREVRYAFGIFKGSDGRSHLGVERVDRGDGSRDGVGRSGRGQVVSRSHFSV
ncbi:MAG: hypothetical protein M1818_005018 [Claussenomyces sp. TS43310]|nr:MAG: hypothetical protein M1818_005018 [Claussenomyces sp. TS43310]